MSDDDLNATIDRISAITKQLAEGLQQALISQQESEARRIAEDLRSRRRFVITTISISFAILLVIVTASVLIHGQSSSREEDDSRAERARVESEIRSAINRDRQQCSTALLVEFDRRLGDALRVSTQLPRVDPTSIEYRDAVGKLNDATVLITRAQELCYGNKPNPNPVPN